MRTQTIQATFIAEMIADGHPLQADAVEILSRPVIGPARQLAFPLVVRCPWCKRTKDGNAWLKRKPTHSHITDGICPDCFKIEARKARAV